MAEHRTYLSRDFSTDLLFRSWPQSQTGRYGRKIFVTKTEDGNGKGNDRWLV